MLVVLVNRQTQKRQVIHDLESIALVDHDHEVHRPQYYIPNARQQLTAIAFILTRTHDDAIQYATQDWELRHD